MYEVLERWELTFSNWAPEAYKAINKWVNEFIVTYTVMANYFHKRPAIFYTLGHMWFGYHGHKVLARIVLGFTCIVAIAVWVLKQ